MSKLKVAMLMTDAREHWREYDKPDPYFGTAPAALLDGLALLPDQVEVHVVSCTQRPLRAPQKLAPNTWFHSLLVPKLGWLRTGYQGCIRAARKHLPLLQPDIVHGQGTERDCAISAVFSGFPNLITLHGNLRLIARVNRSRPFSYQWLAARMEAFTLPRAGGVVCLSHYTQEAVSDLARKTWVVPNAVDQSFFDVARISEPLPLLLCVGHVCHRKNQQQLIRALEPLAAAESFRLLFLGNAPPEDPYCAEFFKMVEAQPWCAYGGLADRKQLREYLGRATLLALPSLEDNCPMVVLEAMAANVPVLAAKVGGLPDLIQNEVNGLFCDPADLSSIQSGIRRLLHEPACRDALADRAKKLALDRYHPASIARRHLQIYREVLATAS